MYRSGTEQFNAASASGTRPLRTHPAPPRAAPQDTSFKPNHPAICLQVYGTSTTTDVPKPLASSPGRKRLHGKKKGLGGWAKTRHHKHTDPANKKDGVHLPTLPTL